MQSADCPKGGQSLEKCVYKQRGGSREPQGREVQNMCMGSYHEKLTRRSVPIQQVLQSPRAGNIWIIWVNSDQTGVLPEDWVVSAS